MTADVAHLDSTDCPCGARIVTVHDREIVMHYPMPIKPANPEDNA